MCCTRRVRISQDPRQAVAQVLENAPDDDEHERSVQLRAEQPVLERALQRAGQHQAAHDGKPLADTAEPLRDEPHDDATQRL